MSDWKFRLGQALTEMGPLSLLLLIFGGGILFVFAAIGLLTLLVWALLPSTPLWDAFIWALLSLCGACMLAGPVSAKDKT